MSKKLSYFLPTVAIAAVLLSTMSCRDLLPGLVDGVEDPTPGIPSPPPAVSPSPSSGPSPSATPSPTTSPLPTSSPQPIPDFVFDFGETEIKRSRILKSPSEVALQTTFEPVDADVSVRRAELIFWVRKPGQQKVLLFHNGDNITFTTAGEDPGGRLILQADLSNMDKPFDLWQTWSEGYTELIVRATAELQRQGSSERDQVSKVVVIPLIQDAPEMDGLYYRIDANLWALLSNDPDDTSYLTWRHWMVVDNSYPGGPAPFESSKVTFGTDYPYGGDWQPYQWVFRPQNEQVSEVISIVIDKDADDVPDFVWQLDRDDLPIIDTWGQPGFTVNCYFGVEGQTDIEIF